MSPLTVAPAPGFIRVPLPVPASSLSWPRLRVSAKKLVAAGRLSGQAAVEIPDGSIYVDAPHLAQPNSYSCALAAASLARLYGVGPDSLDEFMEGMKTRRSGTNPKNIAAYLNKLGLRASIRQGMKKAELLDLLDAEIPSVLAIQAWAEDESDYDDPAYHGNGHYVAAIGYSTSSLGESGHKPGHKAGRRARRVRQEETFYFMDPSLLCRYGCLSWSELDRRWHDDEGTRKKPKPCWHMAIVVDPNGRKPQMLAERIA